MEVMIYLGRRSSLQSSSVAASTALYVFRIGLPVIFAPDHDLQVRMDITKGGAAASIARLSEFIERRNLNAAPSCAAQNEVGTDVSTSVLRVSGLFRSFAFLSLPLPVVRLLVSPAEQCLPHPPDDHLSLQVA